MTREELYEAIWKRPVRTVASELGITGTALAKICRRLDIPRPSLGYWARLQHGQSPPRVPLPSAGERVPRQIAIRPSSPTPAERGIKLPMVRVLGDLSRPHHSVAKLRKIVRSQRAGADGARVVPNKGETVLRVSEATLARALLIFDALFRALEERGHRVELETFPSEHYTSYTLEVRIVNEKLPLGLAERSERRDHVPTPKETAAQARGDYVFAPRYDFLPTGRLSLTIGGRHGAAHREWTDGAKKRLEGRLGEIVVAIEDGAERQKAQAQRFEEAKRQRELEWRRELHEQALREDLEKVLAGWAEAKQIRAFLEDLEARVPAELRRQERFDAWVRWVRGRADALDTLEKPEALAKAVEPPEAAWGRAGELNLGVR